MTKNKRILTVGIVAFIILSIAGFQYWRRSQSSKVVYREAKVEKGAIAVAILSTGVVQPENRVEIKPPIAGRVEKVLVTEGTRVKKGQVLAWMSSTERAALLDAASARGPEELKRWEALYRATPILAPITGTIIQRNVESGQTFTTQDAILVMSDRLTVKAQVDETDISQIKLKQKAVIILDAYPGQEIPGHVDQIAFDAKTVNNVTTYVVDVLPEETPPFMRSGMTANVTFEGATKQDVLYVPANAIRSQNGHSTVMVREEGSKNPVERDVRTGLSDGKRVEVTSGLSEGETILMPEFKPGAKKTAGQGNPFSPMGRPRGH